MAGLVSYDSDGSEDSSYCSPKKKANETKVSCGDDSSRLAAEYESFEKMLAESGESCTTAVLPVPPPQALGVPSEGHIKSGEDSGSGSSANESGVRMNEEDSSSEEESMEEEEGSSGCEDVSDDSAHGNQPPTANVKAQLIRVQEESGGSSEDESGDSEGEGSSSEEEEEVVKVDQTKSTSEPADSHKPTRLDPSERDSTSRRDPRNRKRSRSRSRSRRQRSHQHRHRGSRRGRSRSRERKYSTSSRGSPHRSHRSKRSRSRDRHHSGRSHGRRQGSRSRHGHHRSSRHHHSDRRRSRSRDRRPRSRDRLKVIPKSEKKPKNFKELMKQQILQAQSGTLDGTMAVSVTMPTHGSKNLVTLAGSGEKVTPQQALLQTMAAMHAKAQEATGVALPKYYNPAAVNPMKYAEQVQKRKLLWSKNKEPEKSEGEVEPEALPTSSGQWSAGTSIQGDQSAKFRKLMGIKGDAESGVSSEVAEEQLRKQDELFSQLDREYAFARMATHTHRGVGLGFASQGLPDTK